MAPKAQKFDLKTPKGTKDCEYGLEEHLFLRRISHALVCAVTLYLLILQ